VEGPSSCEDRNIELKFRHHAGLGEGNNLAVEDWSLWRRLLLLVYSLWLSVGLAGFMPHNLGYWVRKRRAASMS
jgi:hypothetical protein